MITKDEIEAKLKDTLSIKGQELHASDTSIFRTCRRRWYFSSPLQLNLEPAVPQKDLWLGTGVHLALADYYGASGSPTDAFDAWASIEIDRIKRDGFYSLGPEQEQKLTEQVDLGLGMLRHYEQIAPSLDKGLKVIAVEQEFRIPIGDFWIAGKADAIVEWDKALWLMEHKTARVIETVRLQLEEQPGVYLYGLQEMLGVPFAGVLYNFLRKKVPTVPQVLAAGGLSQNKSIDTTYEVYAAEIERLGLNAAAYQDMLLMLKDKGNNFFLRQAVRRSQDELDQIARRYEILSDEMLREHVNIYPNPHPILCKMCPFQAPCIAMSSGSDWKFILNANFRERPPKEEHVEAVADEEDWWSAF